MAAYDPADISLADGTMHTAEFNEVPFVRFRKQLAWDAPKRIKPTAALPYDIAYARENTVFIVNASGLLQFLQEVELDDGSILKYMAR